MLVHEAYERLLQYKDAVRQPGRTFSTSPLPLMRRVLVEHARKLSAAKRGGGQAHAAFEDTNVAATLTDSPELLIDIDRALGSLRPEQVQLTELRFFAGFTLEEAVAEIMGLKPETAKKRWDVVKLLLYDHLNRTNSASSGGVTR